MTPPDAPRSARRLPAWVVPLAVRLGVVAVLALGYSWLGDLRRTTIRAVVRNDAAPGPGPHLPGGAGAGLDPVAAVRVVLIDGVGTSTARTMPAWNQLCERGLDLQVDVGFPTVSLPVQVALWTGRTQQQTGVLFHSGKPLTQVLTAPAIPPQVPDSIAIAESHPYIVQSLGFAVAEPPLAKKPPEGWSEQWIERARAAVAGDARLAFVHVLRVDSAGHRQGKRSAAWRQAVAGADQVLAELLAVGPAGARWLVLSDHDHVAAGGHGGEERAIRVVRACIAGPGITPGRGGPIHIVDVSRAIADSLGVTLAADSPGRPLAAALAAPVDDDDVLPALPRGRLAGAIAVLLVAAAVTVWAVMGSRRRWWAVPWWLPVALISLVVLERVPTLSTAMIYKPKGLDMGQAMAPGLAVLAVSLVIGAIQDWRRALVAQLAVPAAAVLACAIATGAVPLVWGEVVCPVVPVWTGWLSPLLLMASLAAGVAGLVVLATAVLSGSGPSAPPGSRRSEPAAA